MKTVVYGYLSRRYIGYHLRDEKRIVLRPHRVAVYGIIACLLLKSVEAADTDTEHHAYAVSVHLLQIDVTVFHGFHGGYYGILLVEVHLACFLSVDKVSYFEALDFASKLGFEL